MRLEKLAYNVFLDVNSEIKERVVMPAEMAEIAGPPPEEEEAGAHDMKVLISFSREVSVLSMGTYVETGLPLASYGWLLSCVNHFHLPGSGYAAKVSVPTPKEGDERLTLVVSWEVGLYDPDLVTAKGLRTLKLLIAGMLFRLCVESPSISLELTKLYRAEFPSGRLNA